MRIYKLDYYAEDCNEANFLVVAENVIHASELFKAKFPGIGWNNIELFEIIEDKVDEI